MAGGRGGGGSGSEVVFISDMTRRLQELRVYFVLIYEFAVEHVVRNFTPMNIMKHCIRNR